MKWNDFGKLKDKMFNKFKRKKNMYGTLTTFDRLLNDLTREPFTTPTRTYGTFEAEVLEDGKQKVTINTSGHNPKDIKVDVTEDEITIKAKKGEGTSRFVKDIDLTLTVGTDYDGTKSEAKFENGLLTLLIDKKNERKSKTLKISY
jgi:HSP20 family molecular chaperone IbpA